MMKNKQLLLLLAVVMMMVACGRSYKDEKHLSRQERIRLQKLDSAALKVAVMPTLDCLPLYVAQHYQLYDTVNGGVRLKYFHAQMDCDTALERGRVEGSISDLVRARRMENNGLKLRYVASTNAYWQLIANRMARVRKLKQLEDKMVAMTRYSATDLLCSRVTDSAKIHPDHLFRVQINDIGVRMLMLKNNEIDALFLTEPLATEARLLQHNVLLDTRAMDLQLGVLVFRDRAMAHPERSRQLSLFVKAYNAACDSINKYGIKKYRKLMMQKFGIKKQIADSLPADLRYRHAIGPRQKDFDVADKFLKK